MRYEGFYDRAHHYTNAANADAANRKYLHSWAKTVPARLNYLADVITNLVLFPFDLLKTAFGGLQSFWTWGHETQNLKDGLRGMESKLNHAISSFVGIVVTKLGISLRNSANIAVALVGGAMIGLTALSAVAISRADGMRIMYNSSTGNFEPGLYWNLK